jgi:two-component system, chemotaxis family, protein-glutamate methylesterase/glutaminase
MKTIRVVVVEDSKVQRAHLAKTLQTERDIVVVGEAVDVTEAIQIVQATRPDVVTLDLQIPGGGGQVVIEQLMAVAPVPILVLSGSVVGRESEEAVAALVAGAVDVLPKPDRWSAAAEESLRSRVRLVSGVAVVRRASRRTPRAAGRPAAAKGRTATGLPIVAIGASTGGPAALAQILADLGGISATVLVVQHLHADFVDGLVSWMDRVSPLDVELARHGAPLRRGAVHIAPSGVHLRVDEHDHVVLDPEPVTLHRPSVDVLFTSLAERRNGRTVAVLLTGMGEDGAAGLLALRRHGDLTIAQDEQSCVVFGMPRAAQRLGAAELVVGLDQMAPTIVRSL